FSFPGDISATGRYFYEDIITEPVILEQGTMTVPQGLVIGVTLSLEALAKYGTFKTLFKR
ncbi:o-succinylbenzoate synthase, partial [Enterococcus faecalis]